MCEYLRIYSNENSIGRPLYFNNLEGVSVGVWCGVVWCGVECVQ